MFTTHTHTFLHLGLGHHGPCGHAHGVDSPVGVLVDLDVGFLLHFSCGVKQVQNLLVVKLQIRQQNTQINTLTRRWISQVNIFYIHNISHRLIMDKQKVGR